MPQAWGQGDLRALLCGPAPGVMVVVIYHETRGAIESYNFGKQVQQELEELWAK